MRRLRRRLCRGVSVLVVVISAGGCADAEDAGPPRTSTTSGTSTQQPASPSAPEAPSGAEIVVDLASTRQTMEGFGTSALVWDDPHLTDASRPPPPEASQQEILRLLYEDLGLTRLRSVLGPGMEPSNDDQDPSGTDRSGFDFRGKRLDGQIELVKDAMPFGLTDFYSAPVTLEPWMGHEEVDEYVEWAAVLLARWRELGVEPPYFSPVNEPGARAERSGAWLRDVVVSLGARLQREGFSTKLVIPDDLNATEAYRRAKEVLDDPQARQYVGALAYHLYGDDPAAEQQLADLAKQHQLPLWMTEFSSPAFDEWPGSLEWARIMQRVITTADVTAVDYMWGFFGAQDRNALISLSFTDAGYVGHDVRPVYDIIGQFSRFVRPGAVRVEASAAEPISASAFIGPGDQLTVVMVNSSTTAQAVTISLEGGELLGADVEVTRTTASERGASLEPVAASAGGFSTELAGESVTTFVGRRG